MLNFFSFFSKALLVLRNFIAGIGALIREAYNDSALNSKNTDSQRKDHSDDDDYFILPPF